MKKLFRILEDQIYNTIEPEFFISPGIADLLMENETLIGLCIKSIKNDCLWIELIEIFSKYRRENRGTVFIQKYKDMVKKRGCTKIECEPRGGAIEFWKKMGFVDVGRRHKPGTYPKDLSDPIYQKIL